MFPKDVAVIAPYRRQVQKIREMMNKRFQSRRRLADYTQVTVGSTEELQGQERRVVIISTVRSQEEFIEADVRHKLGFLKNPKRCVICNREDISGGWRHRSLISFVALPGKKMQLMFHSQWVTLTASCILSSSRACLGRSSTHLPRLIFSP